MWCGLLSKKEEDPLHLGNLTISLLLTPQTHSIWAISPCPFFWHPRVSQTKHASSEVSLLSTAYEEWGFTIKFYWFDLFFFVFIWYIGAYFFLCLLHVHPPPPPSQVVSFSPSLRARAQAVVCMDALVSYSLDNAVEFIETGSSEVRLWCPHIYCLSCVFIFGLVCTFWHTLHFIMSQIRFID